MTTIFLLRKVSKCYSISSAHFDMALFFFSDEEDMFESDFESTDEEAAQGDAVAGEATVQEEEKRVRKVCIYNMFYISASLITPSQTARSKVEKAMAIAHVRNKATFNPQAHALSPSKSEVPKRRVSMGTVIDAETGETVESSGKRKRQSQRKHTVLNTSATVTRMRNAEVRKVRLFLGFNYV
jgi:hypothetical protein